MESIASKVRNLMEEKSFSYRILEEKTGISRSTLQRFVTGVKKDLKIEELVKIAEALNVSSTYLIGWAENPFDILPLPEVRSIPIIGTIACGDPINATENVDGYVSVPTTIDADFALRCKGDSMVGARILDGDIVFIRQQPDVENGEIAAVLIDGEATLKRVHKQNGSLVLYPENSAYAPIVLVGAELENVRILGKAVSFISNVR